METMIATRLTVTRIPCGMSVSLFGVMLTIQPLNWRKRYYLDEAGLACWHWGPVTLEWVTNSK